MKVLGKTNSIVRDAIKLPPLERLQLVDSLLKPLDMLDKEMEELWAKEAPGVGTVTSQEPSHPLPHPKFLRNITGEGSLHDH
jgi:hypothetical protein